MVVVGNQNLMDAIEEKYISIHHKTQPNNREYMYMRKLTADLQIYN